MAATKSKRLFSNYQVFVIAILSFLQFTVIFDFMVLSPLGVFLMDELSISPKQFGLVVSAYAFSAGISGLLAAGFADKFDRKKFLLFFYIGFMIGTLLCAIAPNYHYLLIARIVSGVFGGVIGSVSFSIITDLFPLNVRGRVMGFVMMAFSASRVLGIPVGLVLTNKYGWHASFWLIATIGSIAGIIIALFLKPITEHLRVEHKVNPIKHLVQVVSKKRHIRTFLATTFLSTGGFMMMPFGSTFSIHNLGVKEDQLPFLFGITGVFTFIFGPILGKISDTLGKFRVFVAGSILTILIVSIYTHFGVTPFWIVVLISIIMFIGISSRTISAQALITGIPDLRDRGAFMSVNSSVQQFSGGIASALAGLIVVQHNNTGPLEHYDILGYVVIASMLITIAMMYNVNNMVMKASGTDQVSITKGDVSTE